MGLNSAKRSDVVILRWVEQLLVQVSFTSWKSSSLAAQHGRELGELRSALAKTESFAKVMLRDAAEELQNQIPPVHR